jgi:hypothetical protein
VQQGPSPVATCESKITWPSTARPPQEDRTSAEKESAIHSYLADHNGKCRMSHISILSEARTALLKGTASAVPKQTTAKRPTALPKAGVKPEGRNDEIRLPPTQPGAPIHDAASSRHEWTHSSVSSNHLQTSF